MAGRAIPLEGKTFGRLTVIERVGKQGPHPTWLCRCECGNETVVQGPSLRTGQTRSCGCLRLANNLSGKVFGRLTVIERAENQGVQAAWLCRCECGTSVVVTGTRLRAGVFQSCGCDRPGLNYYYCHTLVRRSRGSARLLSCVDCGGLAEEWSYNHQDPNEIVGVVKIGRHTYPATYSADPEFYDPRCRLCHRAFDRNFKNL